MLHEQDDQISLQSKKRNSTFLRWDNKHRLNDMVSIGRIVVVPEGAVLVLESLNLVRLVNKSTVSSDRSFNINSHISILHHFNKTFISLANRSNIQCHCLPL